MQNEEINDLMASGFGLDIDKLTKEDFIDKTEIYNYIFALSNSVDKQKIILRLQERAKKINCVKIFDKMLKVYQAKLTEEYRQNGSNLINFTNSPIPELKCGKWECTDAGIKKVTYDNIGMPKECIACTHPVLPVERLKNVETGIEKIKISFLKDTKWQNIVVDRSIVANKSKIVDFLADRGIEVTSESSKDLVNYLADIINLNPQKIPYKQSINRLGWFDGGFVPYTSNLLYDGDLSYKSVFEAVKTKGDFEKWKDHIKELRSNKIIKILMASSFASPLLEKVNVLPFLVHLWGTSGGGKTVAIMVAMSIWGNPRLGKLVRTLNMTNVGMTRYASFMHNLPFAADELQIIKKKGETFDTMIMTLCEGIDKTRGTYNGVEELKEWKNVILTSGEQPITNSYSGGGVKNRVVEIEANDTIIENGRETVKIITENYGHAGEDFIKSLTDEDIKLYGEINKEVIDKLKITGKQAMAISCILLADKLTNKYFNDDLLQIEDLKDYAIQEDEMKLAGRVYDLVCEWIFRNQRNFKDNEQFEVYGKIEEEENAVYILPSVLKEFLNDNGVDFESIKKDLARDGKIERDNLGKYTLGTRLNGKLVRCIKLKLEVNNGNELPF